MSQGIGLCNDPGGSVGYAQIEHLARLHEVIQSAHGLLNRRHGIPRVNQQDVEVIRFQAPETPFQRPGQVLSMTAMGIGVVRIHGQRILACHNEVIPLGMHELSHPFFAGAVHVDVGGIDIIPTDVGKGIEDLPAFFFGVAHGSPFFAKGHGPQTKLRNSQSRLSQ